MAIFEISLDVVSISCHYIIVHAHKLCMVCVCITQLLRTVCVFYAHEMRISEKLPLISINEYCSGYLMSLQVFPIGDQCRLDKIFSVVIRLCLIR